MSIRQKKINLSKLWSKISKNCRFKECVFPDKSTCSKKVIKAHSIQRSKILTYIAQEGKVISSNVRTLFYTRKFDKVGVNSASTFFGFCGNHDNSLFTVIENNDYNKDSEHNFLYAYRACAIEYVYKWESLCRLNNLIKEVRNSPIIVDLGSALYGTEQALKDGKIFLNKFSSELTKPHEKRDFDIISTKVFELSFESLLAVSSMLYIEYDFQGNKINDLNNQSVTPAPIFLTVFPQNNKTFILFSCLSSDLDKYQSIITELDTYSNSQIEIFLSSLIIIHCENWFMAPSKYERIPERKKKTIVSKFIETTATSRTPDYLTRGLSLSIFRLMENI